MTKNQGMCYLFRQEKESGRKEPSFYCNTYSQMPGLHQVLVLLVQIGKRKWQKRDFILLRHLFTDARTTPHQVFYPSIIYEELLDVILARYLVWKLFQWCIWEY